MIKNCIICGAEFEAKRTASYCLKHRKMLLDAGRMGRKAGVPTAASDQPKGRGVWGCGRS